MSDYGLQLVAPGENPKVDIVFVHGLRANMAKTWTKNGTFWPGELLPKDVPEARIFLFGYDAIIVSSKPGAISKTEVHRNADDLCAKLAAERSNTPDAVNRPIIIIAHSLGGLVAAQLFVHGEQSNDDLSAKAIVKNICGLLFLGTPFRGSVVAGPAESVRRILQLLGADTQETTLKSLGLNSEKTNELTRSFSNLFIKRKTSNDQVHAFFFYETLTTQLTKWKHVQIAENDSAQLPDCGDTIPIRADHHDICKFTTREEEGYGLIVAAIRKCLKSPEAVSQSNQSGNNRFNNYGKAINFGNFSFGGGQTNTLS
ncbi:hypothetical protein RRF57_012944 [Xylaria bambusicola]|uniref:DUF676 domain-containing protein n=1 Tax=Xylaria bambusicola TaxID=326684 RepID=A0AAN7ZBC2_9PEZI